MKAVLKCPKCGNCCSLSYLHVSYDLISQNLRCSVCICGQGEAGLDQGPEMVWCGNYFLLLRSLVLRAHGGAVCHPGAQGADLDGKGGEGAKMTEKSNMKQVSGDIFLLWKF